MPTQMRACEECGEMFSARDSLHRFCCHTCRTAYWRHIDPERARQVSKESSRRRRLRNPVGEREDQRRWRCLNREKSNAYQRRKAMKLREIARIALELGFIQPGDLR